MKGELSPIMQQMKTIQRYYRPTPWLVNNYQHTLYGMRDRPRPNDECVREPFKFSDGGSTFLDWFNPKTIADKMPIVVICHTYCGGTREPCVSNLLSIVANHGWRAVVANARGCSGAKFTGSAKFYNNYDITDLQEIIEHIRPQASHIFLIGYSYGSCLTAQYSARDGRVDGVILVSNPCDMDLCNKCLNGYIMKKYFLSFIMSKLHHLISKNQFVPEDLRAKAQKTNSIGEFDDVFTVSSLGLKNRKELYDLTNLKGLVPKMKAPTLFIVADDDPFTRPYMFPVKEINESQNMAIVHTKEGGHVSFLTGWDAKESFIDPIIIEYFSLIEKKKNEGN
ncbi:Clan SC, family S33, methylesterase-like serine peptidase [Trichomonas vaginalis G3]|uniref:Clan SC, family S33, methylesterase-like serine peptidase n=1 Tax=Trichomonas vaginalis (strain ATCC PRA-98 / G3) TaxID=412133 RepID=A2D7I4_TRIV3|nr:acylglycerol lipase protein [Trichomonas vaginalis G3]EAY23701.1 Clan SC, family S33, methylesterase-like serine peptidase [Trichomonas vaginalis G3]KAI5490196.1 acylglycerol lipase protein [Trichomonas vaginalis G3]|eukprot:XP_001276949.1 Clan SC, family S33, methylesterase-like serine peptidase [Trichomonas vaginalis G3]